MSVKAANRAVEVLIVEDDRDIRESILELLADEGISALAAEHGEAALSYLRSGSLPRLILLDLMMPVMDGFAFRNEQLKVDSWKGIPVVIMSADGHVDEKRARAGAAAYLRKPVDIYELVTVVKSQLAGSSGA